MGRIGITIDSVHSEDQSSRARGISVVITVASPCGFELWIHPFEFSNPLYVLRSSTDFLVVTSGIIYSIKQVVQSWCRLCRSTILHMTLFGPAPGHFAALCIRTDTGSAHVHQRQMRPYVRTISLPNFLHAWQATHKGLLLYSTPSRLYALKIILAIYAQFSAPTFASYILMSRLPLLASKRPFRRPADGTPHNSLSTFNSIALISCALMISGGVGTY